MRERRKSERRITLQMAKIGLDATKHIDCVVVNISQSGACILVSAGTAVPDSFELAFDRENIRRCCQRVWGDGPLIGVRFSTETP
jgi:hypothetical protein